MPHPSSPTTIGRLRRFASLVYERAGLDDRPTISGLIDLENEYRWRQRP